jgi:AraC-like DNA-binding protein
MRRKKIPDGFLGQKYIVLPDSVIRRYTKYPPYRQLFMTDIGFFPQALHHYMNRPKGCGQHILIYCVDGEGWFSTPHGKKKVKPGQWFMVPKGLPHSYGAHPARPWSIYWVHVIGTGIDYFAQQMGKPLPRDAGDDRLRITMWEEVYAAAESGYSTENIGVMCMSLWRFLGSFLLAERYCELFSRQQAQPLNSVIEFMKENVYRRLTLSEIARTINLSVSHFSALFKKQTGYSPLDYFLHLKMQKACQMLDLTGMRIKEICRELGYDDPYFFSRLFKKIMGRSPGQYRDKNKR